MNALNHVWNQTNMSVIELMFSCCLATVCCCSCWVDSPWLGVVCVHPMYYTGNTGWQCLQWQMTNYVMSKPTYFEAKQTIIPFYKEITKMWTNRQNNTNTVYGKCTNYTTWQVLIIIWLGVRTKTNLIVCPISSLKLKKEICTNKLTCHCQS